MEPRIQPILNNFAHLVHCVKHLESYGIVPDAEDQANMRAWARELYEYIHGKWPKGEKT